MNSMIFNTTQNSDGELIAANRNAAAPSMPGNGLNARNVILRLIESLREELSGKDAEIDMLRAKNKFLEQFAPKDDFGTPNRNGKPKVLIRRGCYTSRNGRNPKYPNPDKAGEEQLEFDFDHPSA